MSETRIFEDTEARRERVPLMVGLVGPSGSGKTYSALRLAKGIQRVTGGEIHVIDTEARRALHYADQFKPYRHIDFKAPFGPLDYLAAIEYCAQKGAKVVVVDSMSHEHEGPGGVLEMHAAEVERLCRGDESKADRVKMLAWQKPKSERRRMINTILQLQISTIFCFRAKEKMKIVPGKPPVPLGYMAIAGEEFVYEMTVNCLLLPKSGGIPTWESREVGERETMKLPEQFRHIFAEQAPLSEDIGAQLAQWAEGDAPDESKAYLAKIADIGARGTIEDLNALGTELGKKWPKPSPQKSALGAAFKAAQKAIADRGNASPAQREPGEEG